MRKVVILVILLLILVSGAVLAAQLGPEIRWWSVDGGGGRSSGDGFALSGSIGQLDVGQEMSGGSFSVRGGYWNASLTEAPPSNPIVLLPLLMK